MLKAISIGKAFKDAVNCYVYTTQTYNPLSNIELVRVSDREATVKFKNCVMLRRVRDLVKKAGLEVDPKFIREAGSKIFLEVFKEFEVARDLLLNLNIKHFVKKAVDIPRNYPRI